MGEGRGGEVNRRSLKAPPPLPVGETEATLSLPPPSSASPLPGSSVHGVAGEVGVAFSRRKRGRRLTLAFLGPFHMSLAGEGQGRLQDHRRPPLPSSGPWAAQP